jgi:hypothetical protein
MNYRIVVFMICCLGAVSCSDDLYEPATKSSGYVNTVRKDGISFKLSLLNEEGKPATVFREGENFSFRFEMENLRKNDKRKASQVICASQMGTGGFGKVFTPDHTLACVRDIMCTLPLSLFPFDGENRYTATVPLYDTQHPPVVLPKGDYYTGFTYTFVYAVSVNDGSPIWDVEVGPVTMRIDFTVE